MSEPYQVVPKEWLVTAHLGEVTYHEDDHKSGSHS